jgi:hypothetical protein
LRNRIRHRLCYAPAPYPTNEGHGADHPRTRPPNDPPTARRPAVGPRARPDPALSASRSGGGSGAPPAQPIRPARGTGEAGAAGAMPEWPQFPLPARRLQRPLSDNAPLSDLPLPRNPPLRPSGLHNTGVMQTTGRGTRPFIAGGAHGRAPCTPGPRGGPARPRAASGPPSPASFPPDLRQGPIMPGFPARPGSARAGPP